MKCRPESLPGSWGTFPRAGKACSVSGGHFPGREKLARFQGDISPGGKSLLGSRGTFSRVGKACSVSGEHFPEWENLPRSAATLLRAWKPCCVLRQAFNDGMLVAVVSVRPHQGVCDTPLRFAAKYLHKLTPSISVSSTNKW